MACGQAVDPRDTEGELVRARPLLRRDHRRCLVADRRGRPPGELTALVVITLIWLAVGIFSGDSMRTTAPCSPLRRRRAIPGVAMAVASLTGESLAPIGVLLAVTASEFAVVPYKLWRKRLRAAGPAAAGRAPTGAH